MRFPPSPLKTLKIILVSSWLIFGLFLGVKTSFSEPVIPPVDEKQAGDYVGSETCQACHEAQFNNFSKTAHAKLHKAGWATNKQGCESCHGPGKAHVEGGGDKSKIRTFENFSSKKTSEACLECHAGKESHNNFLRGEHWRNDVGCTECHSAHGEPIAVKSESGTLRADTAPVRDGMLAFKMLKNAEPQLCLECHKETRSQFTMPFHHKVLEGTMKCSDCHNPHGGFESKQTRLAVGADAACLKCHTDKQGPFVFEHAPLKVEGCTACHTPHGSSNAKMLTRSKVNQLCLECHSNIGEFGAPNTPSFHNQATVRFQDCTVCHAKIHGSNTHPVFFR